MKPTEQRYVYGPNSAVEYTLNPNAHWIQARKAWDDDATWVEGMAIGSDGDAVTVVLRPLLELPDEDESGTSDSGVVRGIFDLAEKPLGSIELGRKVWVNERWGVLAYVDHDGNAIAIQPLGVMPESVFAMAGFGRLKFVSARRQGEPEEVGEVLAYANVRGHDDIRRFSIVPLDELRHTVDVLGIFNYCETWGEVRRQAPLDIYNEVLEQAGYEPFEYFPESEAGGWPVLGGYPDDGKLFESPDEDRFPYDILVFDPGSLSGVLSADYPENPAEVMRTLIPSKTIEEVGESFETMLGQELVEFPPDASEEMIAEMEGRGHLCVEAGGLFSAELDRFEWMSRIP